MVLGGWVGGWVRGKISTLCDDCQMMQEMMMQPAMDVMMKKAVR